MTRFARAKGSKASNEKAPEDATPWDVMKEQLLQAKKENEDAKNRQAAENQRIENYENFLKERRVQKRPSTWCDFPEAEQNKRLQNEVVNKKNKKKKERTDEIKNVVNAEIDDHGKESKVTKKKKTKNRDSYQINVDEPRASDSLEFQGDPLKGKKNKHVESPQPTSITGDASDDLGPPKKKKKPKVQLEVKPHQNNNDSSPSMETKSQKGKKNKKKQINHLKDSLNVIVDNANSEQIITNNNLIKSKSNKKVKHQLTSSQPDNEQNGKSEQQYDSQKDKTLINKLNKQKAKKRKKLVDGQPVRRKEINDKSFQLIIGGKEVELVRYDGFPVMKRDAERLAELKDSMIKKGIPKSEVQRTMKLERRRAEKALARLRREVCYNCRKGGHNLSDCPDLKSKVPGADAPEGVCFKCGSTEHRQFECKVQRDKEFRFATCFICKEPGHIARQCPDNPKGLYPNGGSCKLCGDVTHLRKDCPTASNKKEETSVKLQTLDSTEDIEGIGVQNKSTGPNESIKKPKKIRF